MNFTGTSDQWERDVFLAVSYFRLHRYHGAGGRDSHDTVNMHQALTMAQSALEQPGVRVLLYAVTEAGRSVLLPQTRWLEYYKLWLRRAA